MEQKNDYNFYKIRLINNTVSQSIENGNNNRDLMAKLINNMSEINELLKNKILQFFYFNRKIIHDILYENDEFIQINQDILEEKMSNYFYLILLIKDNPNIINYTYSINIINNLANKIQDDKNNILKNILISKIANELINNYRYTNEYEDSQENKLKKIEEKNLEYIKNSLNIINDLNVNYKINNINKQKIDLIYIDIIITLLIKEQYVKNYKNIVNILTQLDIENIKITETMFNEIYKFLNNNEKYKNKYYITNISDLDNIEIIYFYYLLFKYILKDRIYIYQIQILFQIRKNIIINIKNSNQKCEINGKDNEQKEYVIRFLLDSKYYYLKYIVNNSNKSNNNNNNQDNELSTALNKTQDKSSANFEIDETKLNKNDYELFMKKILYKSSFLLKSNNYGKVTFTILDDKKENENVIKDMLNRKLKEDRKILELNFQKLLEFLSIVKEKIDNEFIHKYNLIIKLDFFIDEYHTNSNSHIYNMICKYYFYPPNKDRLSSFQDENVLINGIDGIHQGFYFLINEINDESYKDILYNARFDIPKYMIEKENCEKQLKTIKNDEIKKEKVFTLTEIVKSDVVSEYQVIMIKNIIGNHSDNAEYIHSLINDYYISGGNSRTLYIYNQKYKKILDINLSIHPIGICQIKYQDNENIISIVAFSNENINIITFEPNNNAFIVQFYKFFASNILEISRNKYIIASTKGVYIVNDLMGPLEKYESKKILNYSYRAIIKISKHLIALTSNKILHKGRNRIVIYDLSINGIFYDLEGYSFSLSLNSLLLLDNYEAYKNEKILLCACKKYTSYNNNGILLISIKIEDNEDIYTNFYETERFEPYCFCRILLINNSKENRENSKKEYNTDYFFIGGYDLENDKGVIKLYKIIFNSNKTRIEFIQDIIFSNEDRFKGPVTCITQSRKDGNFLITCSDGFVYLCSPSNINYFLFYDQQEKKQIKYENTILYETTTMEKVEKKTDGVFKFKNSQMFKFLEKSFKDKDKISCDSVLCQ